MQRIILGAVFLSWAGWPALCQSTEKPPGFEAADVHVSAKIVNPFIRTGPVRGGRYEVKNATMVDLIGIAYGFAPNKVLGGPSWLEMDRFDVLAKVPPGSTPETQKLMLQSLLEDRFKLVVRKDTRPLPTYVLTVGKKPQLKEADGSGDRGCKPQSASGPPAEGGMRLMMNGTPISLGPGGTIEFVCRNMTMAAFAEGLRGMLGSSVGPNPVLDQTGLQGEWNFNVHWSLGLIGPMADSGQRISVFDAVDKQLGLKLEEKQIPNPVIVVDSVNRTPSGNPPGTAEALPAIPLPSEFEVASVKPTDPNAKMGRFQIQPGGRLVVEGLPLRFLISRAFNTNNNDQIAGLPPWADTERFDILAKAPSQAAFMGPLDLDVLAPMIRALLADRFKMTYHTEERPVPAYALVSAKPKMKKADPAARTSCKNVDAAPGAPPGTRALTCQNITMAQFADRLQNLAPGLNWPVSDATEIEGGWDFTLSFSMTAGLNFGPIGRGPDAGQPGVASASDPNGGYTVFEALEKQLGLKLEKQKRTLPVIVIDHIEQKPTDN